MNPRTRKVLVVAATAFAVAAPGVQAWTGWGLDQPQFAAQGDGTLQAAGWAFAIWSLIYAGLIVHAAAQAFDHGLLEPIYAKLAPSIIAIAGCGAWIWASAADARWVSVLIILVSAGSAWLGLWRVGREPRHLRVNLVAVWPIAFLGGWLLAASALNILTVMTAEGLIGEDARSAWALGGIASVVVLAVVALWNRVSLAYAIPVAWGFVGVYAAERVDQPAAALGALVAAGAVIVATGVVELRRRAQA